MHNCTYTHTHTHKYTHRSALEERFEHKIEELKAFGEARDLPIALREKLYSYYSMRHPTMRIVNEEAVLAGEKKFPEIFFSVLFYASPYHAYSIVNEEAVLAGAHFRLIFSFWKNCMRATLCVTLPCV